MIYDVTLKIIYDYANAADASRQIMRLMPLDIPGEQRLVTGAAALLPVAIAPSVLQQLRAGQEIDQDPVTKVRTWIEAADADTVCVSLQSPTEQSRTWFDTRTGMTVQFSRVQRQGTGTTTIQARLQR